MLDATGERTTKDPFALLRICTRVHITDRTTCVPFWINRVDDKGDGIVSGHAQNMPQFVPIQKLGYDNRPDIPPRITVINAAPTPTWHWPQECPWGR